jgi:hypothetical protein
MYTKFGKDCFSHSKVDGRVLHRQHEDRISQLSFYAIKTECKFSSRQIQKVTVWLSDSLIKHRAMKLYGRMEIQVHVFLTSPLQSIRGDEKVIVNKCT